MTLSRITLERFDGDCESPLKESPDYYRGFKDGLAQAADSQSADHQRAVADIAAVLGDLTFGFAEARVHLLDRIRPLLAQIGELVLPEIAREAFAAHLIEVLEQSFAATMDQPVEIGVAPEIAADLNDVLSTHQSQFALISDPDVALGQAVLRQGETHLMIDFPALLSALQAALNGLEPSSERINSNG